jgi:hypothetical protein
MYNNLWRMGGSGVAVLRYDDLNEEAKHVATGNDEVSRLRGTGWEEVEAMVQTVCVMVESADRERLAAIVADRNGPRKHVRASAHRARLG